MARNLTELSKHIIELIEKRFIRDYALVMQVGAELEWFAILTPEGKAKARNDTISWGGKHKQGGWLPANEKRTEDKPPIYRESVFVTRVYDDTNKSEVVFSHEAYYDFPVGVAVADRIAEAKNGGIEREIRENGPEELREFLDRVVFDAYYLPESSSYESARRIQALQIPMSFITDDGEQFFPKIWGTDTRLATYLSDREWEEERLKFYIQNAMYEIIEEATIIMAPNENSYDRLRDPFPVRGHYRATGTKAHLIETRIAGADVDPYQAMAISYIALYYALSNQRMVRISDNKLFATDETPEIDNEARGIIEQPGFKTCTPNNGRPIITKREQAIEAFEKETKIKDLLNKLEDGLGEEFHDAVIKNIRNKKNTAVKNVNAQPSTKDHTPTRDWM